MAYKYKYKPLEFKNPYASTDKTVQSLETQKRNLEKRFKEQGIDPAQFEGAMDKRNFIEKGLNLKQDQGLLFDIFEVVDRPREMIANMIESTADPRQNILEGAWEGLSGKDRVSSREALETATGSSLETGSKVGDFLLDVGLDIATDPLTFIPGGAIAKQAGKLGTKGAKVGAELLEAGIKRGGKLGAVATKTDDVIKAIKKVGTKVGHSFDATKGLSDEMVAEIGKIRGQVDTFKIETQAQLKEIQERLLKVDPDAGKYLGEALENNVVFRADGTVHYKKFQQTGGEMLDDLVKNANRKGTSNLVLARTTKGGVGRVQLKSMVDDFNKVAKNNGMEDLFKFNTGKSRTRGVLEFKGTADELKLLRELDEFKAIEDTVVNFGERRMSEKARKFFANSEDGKKALDDVKRIRKETRELMQSIDEAGVAKYFKDFGDDVGKSGAQGYMRHTLTEGANEYLEGAGKAVSGAFTSPGSARFGERSYKATARDINKTLQEVYGHGDDLFNEDAFKAMEGMIEEAGKTYTQTQMAELVLDPKTLTKDGKGMFQSLSENTKNAKGAELDASYKLMDKGTFDKEFSNLNKNLPPEFKANLDTMLNQAGATGDAVGMQRSVYDIMKKFDNAYKEVPEFWKGYDKLLNKWKSLNLISGGFHTRNFAGNTTNMYLAGMNARDIMKYTKDSVIERGRYKKLFKRMSQGEVLKGADKKFYDEVAEFYKSGIAQGHAGVRDLGGVADSIANKAGKEKGILGKVYDKVEKVNYDLAEGADDLQRYAMWKWAKNKHGGDLVKAGKEVRTALFDYSALTGFEKDVMKRLVPFYTFMKNNLAFQGKNLIQNPQKYARLGRAYDHYTEDIAGMNREDMPEYMQENMWLPIPSMFDSKNPDDMTFLKMNLPPAEFAEFVENPLKRGVTSLTVPIKLAWEVGTNRNSFTGAEIKKYEGQRDGGFKDGFRNEKGNLTLTGDPMVQKIFDDLGMRQPRNYASLITDLADWAGGGQEGREFSQDFFKRLGISDTKDMKDVDLSRLYEELNALRDAKKVYEQEYGEKLPWLK